MPVENTTTNNAFRYPTAANPGTAFAQGIADLASDVDGMWSSGTLVARPAAGGRGRVYYATDTGLFYKDTGSAWLTLLSLGRCLASRTVSGSITANPGDLVYATLAPSTVTLPASPPADTIVGVVANVSFTGSSPLTVSAGSSTIFGVGLSGSGASSFTLGTPLSSVVLQYFGGAWVIISGQQDTGWVAMTLPTNWNAFAGFYVPATRLIGNTVLLRGAVSNNTGGSAGLSVTLAARFVPAANVQPVANAAGAALVSAITSGVLTTPSVISGAVVSFDGSSYSIA